MDKVFSVEMRQFERAIEFIKNSGAGIPRTFTIDLSIALLDQPYDLSGNLFYVLDAPDGDSYIEVRFNERNNSAIPLYHQIGLETPFKKLYITTPAGQSGTMTILTAVEAPDFMKVIDNRSATTIDLNLVRAELTGDTDEETWDTQKTVGVAAVQILAANANRKGCVIQAKSTNTGIIYLGFDNTVTAIKWFYELQPGMSFVFDDYRGEIQAIATAAGQLAGWGEW